MPEFNERTEGALIEVVERMKEFDAYRHTRATNLDGSPIDTVLIHKTPMRHNLYSRRARPFAIQGGIDAEHSTYGHITGTTLPRWSERLTQYPYHVYFGDPAGADMVHSMWTYDASVGNHSYASWGGNARAWSELYDYRISVLDAYAAGSCVEGTRRLINLYFNGDPIVKLGELLEVSWDKPLPSDWPRQIKEIIAWAVTSQDGWDFNRRERAT